MTDTSPIPNSVALDLSTMSETEKDLRNALLHIEKWIGYELRPVEAGFANRIAEIAGRVARGQSLEEAVNEVRP